MAQQFANPQVKIRTAILLFLKSAPQPLVLYSANPIKDYEELKNAMKTPNVVYEKDNRFCCCCSIRIYARSSIG